MSLASILGSGRKLRAIGFDDAPFTRDDVHVPLVGVVTSNTRFEGLLWGQATRDGVDGTDAISDLLAGSKFAAQVHVVLTDGITVGGLNLLDLQALQESCGVPCIAVMRKKPDLVAFERALSTVNADLTHLERAGPIHPYENGCFQTVACDPEIARAVLLRLTDRGKVPEPLRLAHLIGAGVVTGTSGKRA